MERLTVIMGRPGEGKSTELFLEYVSHFIGIYTSDDEEPKKLRDALKPVFIICDFNGIDAHEEFDRLIESLQESDFNPEQWDDIINGIHIMYSVSDKDTLEDILRRRLLDMDCIFYLDNCDELITVEQAVNWISDLSIVDELCNLDIVMTKNK